MLILFFLILRFLLVFAFVFVVVAMVSGAPFVPMPAVAVEKITALMRVVPGEKIADLGSGDGRLVISLAKAGAEAHGYEINPFLVIWSRIKIYRAGVSGKAFIHWGNYWRKDLSGYSGIALYGISHIMAKLEKKLTHDLKPGARVISYVFTFPTLECLLQDEKVNLYKVG